MGDLTSPTPAGQWTQLSLDTNAATSQNSSGGLVTMTSYAAAGIDVNQAIGMESMLEYLVTAGGGSISEWILTLNETVQLAAALLVEQAPLQTGTHDLTNNGYIKLRFTLQSAPVAGNAYIDGFAQDSVILTNGAVVTMRPFGLFTTGANSAISPAVALNLTEAFTLQLTAQPTGGGNANVSLKHLYTRYFRTGP
jgi:hypothetical protein